MSSLISPSSPGSASSSSPSSPPSPPSPNLASRPVRATRGRRLTDLHGEGDDDFWQQEFFTAAQDDDEDFDLREEADAEAEDVVDSDFFDSEEEEQDDDGDEEKEAKQTKKKGQYVDPRAKKPKAAAPPRAKPKAAAAPSQAPTSAVAGAVAPPTGGRSSSPLSFLASIGGVRKSSRSSTITAGHSLHLKEEQRRRSTRSLQRGKLSFPVLSQAQQLEEAVETERQNRESLQQLLRIEEERKKVHLRKKKGKGPTVLLHSSKASTTLSWSTSAPLPAVFSEVSAPLPYRRCVVSNAPARYLHRWTGQPFRGVGEWRAMEEAWRRGEKFVNSEQTEREREEKEREKKRGSKRDRADKDERMDVDGPAAPHEEAQKEAPSPALTPGQQKRGHKKRARGAVEEVAGGKEEVEDKGEKAAAAEAVEEVKEATGGAEEEGGGGATGGVAEARKGSPTNARTAKRAKTTKTASKAKGKG